MTLIDVNDIAGRALDWAVATCKGTLGVKPHRCVDCRHYEERCGGDGPLHYCRNIEWAEMEFGWTNGISPTDGVWDHCPIDENTPEPYSTDWSQGGPIIEREGINIIRGEDDWTLDSNGYWTPESKRIPVWVAVAGQQSTQESYNSYGEPFGQVYEIYEGECINGPTPLVAAMRCYVASKMGKEIVIPDELA